MYSFMVLMPAVCIYLFSQRQPWRVETEMPSRKAGMGLIVCSVILEVIWFFLDKSKEADLATEDSLAIAIGGYLAGVAGVTILTLGWKRVQASLFPLGMLLFLIPIPGGVMDAIEEFLQYGSAYAALGMFRLALMNISLKDLDFTIPNVLVFRVAPECSGIHSTYILLIPSLLAGYLFLRSGWNRIILTAAVLPLALLRNGFRIFTIGELCRHYGAQMIDSWIHHKGGPVFFVLSLIPFFLLLAWLRHRDAKHAKYVSQSPANTDT